jgi:hypothetical protein
VARRDATRRDAALGDAGSDKGRGRAQVIVRCEEVNISGSLFRNKSELARRRLALRRG